MPHIVSLVALFWPLTTQLAPRGDGLQTVAERTGFRATARYDDVATWCRAFAKAAPSAHLMELGRSAEGRSIPLLVLADPPVRTPQAAARSGKLVCLVIGDIHAGEVCGKEALPMLLREDFSGAHPPLLKELILAVAPIFNVDGNERVSKTNRPGQLGPEEGTGQRANARGLDLNRDFMKLEAPETQALVRFVNEWNPHLFIDTHTTNGSYHRYTITYDGPKNPAGDPRITEFMRRTFFPELSSLFKKHTGWDSFYYGNFNREHTQWTSFPAQPRYGTTYLGLRNRLAILSEAYAYAPYKTRILATRDFVRDCLQVARSHRTEIVRLLEEARTAAARRDEPGQPAQLVSIRSKPRAPGRTATILGYAMRQEQGRPVKTDDSKEYTVQLLNEFEAAEAVSVPFAYLIPSTFHEAVATLKRHGLELQELREDVELDLEIYRIEAADRSARRFEGHHVQTLKVSPHKEARRVEAGTLIVRTAQPLGSLAVSLLEPGSEDGLATWNYFDSELKTGGTFPVWRLPRPASFLTTAAEELAERRGPPRPVTFESTGGGGFRGAFGRFTELPRWLDPEHWLQVRDRRVYKVHARSGRSQPFVDMARLTQSLARLPSIDQAAAGTLARRAAFDMGPMQRSFLFAFDADPTKRGFLFEHGQDLYYATFDGSTAVRLTSDPGREQWPQFSRDGKSVAFVRDYDLFVVDLATQKERRLTTGGTSDLRHGHADWVYFEEIFNRRWPAFWWSPESKQLAFLEFDATGVPYHTVLDDSVSPRRVERTHYPRSGEPNPKVRMGIVASAGGPIQWADLSEYSPDSFLISEVGWWSDGSAAYCYVQDRAQTWLDLIKVTPEGQSASTRRLFRDATRTWIESPGPPHVLDDKTFLWLSERDGWKHLYHYDQRGNLKTQLTSGPWELRRVEHVDPKNGWIYFSATRDNPAGLNYYRLRPGATMERLTEHPGSHNVAASPDGRLFISSWSDPRTPPQIRLYDSDGALVRTVDSNPSHELKRLRFGPRERFQIPARDGFPLEAEIILPPDLTPGKKYPVWFTTYGGPHAPTVSDAWNGGRMWDHALAHEGFVVFHMDPRPASGKGAASAWTAYKHLGVQELEDIKTAINWLKERPFVDGARIGMSGHSYGGYMTSYAMTHCDLFAAGIAGAPVTDWRDYDSIYTERYMGLPQDNPDGYRVSSVVGAAGNLHGKLLILHGAIDDNVSLRNTMRLVEALQEANKDFELMIYPASRHGIFGTHYNKLQLDFIKRTLGARTQGERSASAADLASKPSADAVERSSRRERPSAGTPPEGAHP
jgi:dipeptidyl aminopeptidase/acylaminoacyl peptidase